MNLHNFEKELQLGISCNFHTKQTYTFCCCKQYSYICQTSHLLTVTHWPPSCDSCHNAHCCYEATSPLNGNSNEILQEIPSTMAQLYNICRLVKYQTILQGNFHTKTCSYLELSIILIWWTFLLAQYFVSCLETRFFRQRS